MGNWDSDPFYFGQYLLYSGGFLVIKGNVFMASNLGRVMIEALEVLAIKTKSDRKCRSRKTLDPF